MTSSVIEQMASKYFHSTQCLSALCVPLKRLLIVYLLVQIIEVIKIECTISSSNVRRNSASNLMQYTLPEVRLPHGLVRGRIIKSSTSGREYSAFLGIPYATPPLGQLRFRAPMPPVPWTHILSATTYREPCPQFDSRATELGNEDCLYLNVYTPSINSEVSGSLYQPKYPVMVYVQAESFENGDSSLYGGDKLVDHQVVLVTFNYRLGVLGFLSTEDNAASGNWGLHDQRMVLQWIKANIDLFSGDANRVTLFGQGAGAASVLLHLASPGSDGLFHRAIAQSGSALCDWAIERDPLTFAQSVAQSVGCTQSSTDSMVECLRTVSSSSLLRAQSKFKTFGEFPQRAAPVIEKIGLDRFISIEPSISLSRKRSVPLPLMIGVNRDESAFFYPMISEAFTTSDVYFHEKELLPRFLESATNIRGYLKDRVIPSILFNYFNGVDLKNLTSMANRFINMSTDALYVSCVDDTVKTYWRSQSPVYQYLFEYSGSNSMLKLLMNTPSDLIALYPPPVCHGDELFYLFNLRILGLREESMSDMQTSHRMTTLWTDFAKVGFAPRITSVEFPPWHKFDSDKLSFYRISNDLSPSFYGYRQSASYFWTHQMKNISNMPNVHPLMRPSSSAAMLVHGSSITANDLSFKILAFTLIGVSICLLILVIFLLILLFFQRRSQIFRATTPVTSSAGSTLY